MIPCKVISPGTRLDRLTGVGVGTIVVIYSHGRFRRARVVKRTPTRVQVAFSTPARPNVERKLYRHIAGRWVGAVFTVDRHGEYEVAADINHARYAHDLIYHDSGTPGRLVL